MLKQTILATLGILCLTFMTYTTNAQSDWKYGFELGWTNSKISGETEEIESQEFNAGFHFGVYTRRHFTDNFGVQFGLLYTQRGGNSKYTGNSYYVMQLKSQQPLILKNITRNETNKIINHYLDIPVIAFQKFGKLEVGLGGYAGYMIGSKSEGDIRVSSDDIDLETFFVETDKKYFKNKFSDASTGGQTITLSGIDYAEPRIIGAYYEYFEDPGESLYNRFDAGLMGQVAYYFNESLNIRGKFSYGLLDVTEAKADLSRAGLTTSNEQQFRDDMDRNLSMQISIGFLF